MPSMDAILRIRARAEGKAEITELDRAMRRLGPGAESSAPGVGRLNRMLSEMGTIAGGIGLAGLGAGLLRFGGESIKAGDEAVRFEQRLGVLADRFGETAQMMDFISQASERYSIGLLETGDAFSFLYAASREMVSNGSEVQTTFRGIMNLARQVGLPIYEAREAMRQWTQSIGEGRLNGQEYISMMQRLPMLNRLLVRAFNELRQESGQPLITKEKADQMVAAVKEGEKRQTEEIKKGILDRKNAAERETDDLLREIEKRYERQRRIIGDKNEDIDNEERKARDKQAEDEREAIELRYAEQRKAYERNYEDERERFLRDNKGLSEEALKEIERRSQDQKEIDLRYLDEKKESELEALQERVEAEATERSRALRDQRRQQEEALSDQQRMEEAKVREGLEKRRQELDFDLKRQVDATGKANEEIIAGILSRVQVTEGQLKKLAEEGKIGADVMTRVMEIASRETTFPAATPLDRLTKSMSDLRLEIGDNLQPLLRPLADGVDLLVKGFGRMPESLQATAIGLIAIGGAAVGVRALLGTVGQVKALTDAFRGLSGAAKAAKVTQTIVPTITAEVAPNVAKELTESITEQLDLDLFNRKKGGMQYTLDLDRVTKPPKLPDITPEIKAPRPGLFRGVLGDIGKVSKALLGLAKQFVLFGLEYLKFIPGVSRLGAAATPAVMAIRAAFTGLLGWMATTFVPGMVAFFSGPAGWIALGVAALIAGIVIFHEPIMQFLDWVLVQIEGFWKGVWDFIYGTQIKPWVDLFNLLKEPLGNALQNMTTLFTEFWRTIARIAYDLFLAPVVGFFTGLWERISEPLGIVLQNVQGFFSGLGNIASIGFKMVADFLYWLLIEPWVKWWGEAQWAATKVIDSIAPKLEAAWTAISTTAYVLLLDPWVRTWNELQAVVSNMATKAVEFIKGMWSNIIKLKDGFLVNWMNLWRLITAEPEKFKNIVGRWFDDLYSGIVNTWKKIPATIQTIWDNVTSGMSRTWQNMMNGVRNMLNDVIGVWNGIASKTRGLPGFAQLPSIPLIPQPQAFATGGFVSGPTLGLIGEGRNPREYIIPEGSMDAAAAGWQAGLRGNQLVSAWQSPGLAPGRATTSAAMASGPVQITISGGTVQMPDGTQMVTLDQVEAIATAITRAAAPNIVRASIQATGQVMAGAAGRSRYGLS